MSPGTRIQRSVCMVPDCMNSAERAYQVPCSIDAHAWSSPTGSMLRMTMKIRPKFRDQKESFNGALLPLAARVERPQAKQREAKTEHSIHAEQSGVAMDGSKVESLNVVKGDGRIDEEAEQSGSDQIPERNGDEEIDGPLVVRNPLRFLRRLRKANVLPCFIADQRQRHNFKCTEDGAETNHRRSCTCEVKMMEGADDSAGKEDGRREERGLGSGSDLNQLESREQEPDHNSREYFEEAFNPEVNHPPAPVFRRYKMAALTVHQARRIEERNGNAGDKKQDQKRAVLALANQRRLESRDHQDQP